MRHIWLKAGIIAAAVVVILASARLIAAPAFIAHPDTVHIVVTEVQPLTQRNTVLYDHQFTAQATAIYGQLVAGGTLPDAPSSCPAIVSNQSYYRYRLTFSHWGIQTAIANDDAVGCMYFGVQYPLGIVRGYSWYRDGHPSFWVWLNQSVNTPEPGGICLTLPSCHS